MKISTGILREQIADERITLERLDRRNAELRSTGKGVANVQNAGNKTYTAIQGNNHRWLSADPYLPNMLQFLCYKFLCFKRPKFFVPVF